MREARLRPEFAHLYPGLTPGRWEPASRIAEAVLANVLLHEIGEAPLADRLLDEAHFDTPYRPGGWTVRQVVHHVPDSHINAYTRIRLALTEDTPTIKPYEEARWAELPDARSLPI